MGPLATPTGHDGIMQWCGNNSSCAQHKNKAEVEKKLSGKKGPLDSYQCLGSLQTVCPHFCWSLAQSSSFTCTWYMVHFLSPITIKLYSWNWSFHHKSKSGGLWYSDHHCHSDYFFNLRVCFALAADALPPLRPGGRVRRWAKSARKLRFCPYQIRVRC